MKSGPISLAITIGAMYIIEPYIAARAQLVTFIIFILAVYFMEKLIENPKKWQYGLGIILSSILIANLHVAVWPFLFILSMPYIGEYILAIMWDILVYNKIPIVINKIGLKINKNKQEKLNKINEKLKIIEDTNEKIKDTREKETPYKIKFEKNENVKWLIVVMLICALTGFLTPLGTTPYTYLVAFY